MKNEKGHKSVSGFTCEIPPILPGCERIFPQMKRANDVFESDFYDFSLFHLFYELKNNGYDAHEVKFSLRGYALVIRNKKNLYIRYVGGYLWIGSYGIHATTFGDAYSAIVMLISDILDGGRYADYESIMIERRREKMLKAIEQVTIEASRKDIRKMKYSRI